MLCLRATAFRAASVAVLHAPLLALVPQGAQASSDSSPEAPDSEAGPAAPELPVLPDAHAAVHWADWSGDGRLDAWAVQPDGTGLLLENAGDGSFVDRTEAAGLAGVTGAHQAAWADVDGDGLLDIYFASWRGTSRLFVQASKGDFVDVTLATGLPEHARPIEARWIDFDGDGVADLHLVREAGDLVYRGLGRAQFEEVELGLLPRSGGLALRPLSSTAPGTAGLAGPGVTNVPIATPTASVGSGICATTIEDVATGICINASSTPQMGMLYPISTDLFVDAGTGHVGINTTSPTQRLTVNGNIEGRGLVLTAPQGDRPIIVSSTTKVDGLNADLLDGLSASAFRPAGIGIGSADIVDGTIVNADIANGAMIDGSKVIPNFAARVQSNLGADFLAGSSVGNTGVDAANLALLNSGHLAVQGAVDFGGVLSADYAGDEIGVLGMSTGGSVTDNYGVIGHSNFVGVLGEHSLAPDDNYGILGAEGVGVFGRGEDAAGRFEGKVEVDSTAEALTVSGGSTSTTTAVLSNPGGGSVLDVVSTSVVTADNDTVMYVGSTNSGYTAHVQSLNPSAARAALRVDSVSDAGGHDLARFIRSGNGAGSALRVEVNDSVSPAYGLEVSTIGAGAGARIASASAPSVELNRTDNLGDIFVAANSSDVEFRVESSGNVFCDGTFTGGGADYAEWLERANPEESFHKGDVVGVIGGKISRDLDGAELLLVISTSPCVVGNHPDAGAAERAGHEVVAFMGQVPVRVRGRVRSGDLLIPSGENDGTAVAVRPADLSERQISQVIGRAWETASAKGVHRVNAAIGLERDRIAAIAIAALRTELDDVHALVEALAARVESLEAR